MHENLDLFKDIDAEMYIVSSDLPEEQQLLFNDLENHFGRSITFISDPDLQLIDFMGMKNGSEAYRGYGMMDKDGKVIFKTNNDHWGEQIDATLEEIKEAYTNLK